MTSSERVRVVLSTAGSEADATRIARGLVERRLAACVNVVPSIRSIYRWEGSIADEAESLLVVKTVDSRVEALIAAIRELHEYDVPEILALPVEGGAGDYLDWVVREAR